MPHEGKPHHTGLYEKAVNAITHLTKPSLHKVTDDYIDKMIDENAKGKPEYARIIDFEVRRRGDGAGITQDVSEPLLWTGIKTGAALAIAGFTHRMQNKKFRLIGDATALGIMLNNVVELCRLLPRYKAGLQGSFEMAKDRWEDIERTGRDPFHSQIHALPPQMPKPDYVPSGEGTLSWEERHNVREASKEAQPQLPPL